MNGTIKFYDDVRGFGFILDDAGGDDIFFHISNSMNGKPTAGDVVTFETGAGRQGLEARNVEIVGG